MKKTNSKSSLHLNRETIRVLKPDGLSKVVGGLTLAIDCTVTTNCGDTNHPSCRPQ